MTSTAPVAPAQRRFYRLPHVSETVGLRRSAIYALIKKCKFPAPIKITRHSSAWLSSDIDAWMDERIAASAAADNKGGA